MLLVLMSVPFSPRQCFLIVLHTSSLSSRFMYFVGSSKMVILGWPCRANDLLITYGVLFIPIEIFRR